MAGQFIYTTFCSDRYLHSIKQIYGVVGQVRLQSRKYSYYFCHPVRRLNEFYAVFPDAYNNIDSRGYVFFFPGISDKPFDCYACVNNQLDHGRPIFLTL